MRKVLALTVMLVVVLAAQYQIWRSNASVSVSDQTIAGNPAQRYLATQEPRGVVVVVHGFSANKTVMQPWGYALARQGFEVYVIDQPGHGDSVQPLPPWMGSGELELGRNLQAINDELIQLGRAKPGRIALVGHSMGGFAVTAAALADERIAATVAISSAYRESIPVARPVNFLSLAAERDPAFMVQAVQALARQSDNGKGAVGQQYGEFRNGTARLSAVVDGRNHLSIIYDDAVIEQAADWIHASFGTEQAAPLAASTPWLWVILALAGAIGVVLSAGWMLAPATESRIPASGQPRVGFLTGLVTLAVAAFSAVLACVYLRVSFVNIAVLDYLLPYFGVMATVLLLLRLIWPRDFGFPVSLSQESLLASLLRGLGVFLGYLGAVGTVIQMNLSHYMPSGPRIFPLLLSLLLLWFYFVQEEALKRAIASNIGPWLALLVGVVGKLLILATWLGANALPNPPIFLALVTPVALVLLLVTEFISFVLGRWRFPATAIGTFVALVLAWSIAVIFPLV